MWDSLHWVPICLTLIGMFVIIGGVIFKFMKLLMLKYLIEDETLAMKVNIPVLFSLVFYLLIDLECFCRNL